MATNVGELVVKLTADAKSLKDGLSKAGSEIQGFSQKTQNWFKENQTVILGATAAIGAAVVKSIQAYGEQEQAVAKLNQALANQGKYSEETSKELQNFAQAMQNVTTFGDETILMAQASLVAFGLEGDELKKTTKAAMDLAAAKGIDLRAASELLGKAYAGETGMLSRYGIILGDNVPKAEKFSVALGKVNDMFGGQAETMRNTTLGAWAGLQNAISDTQEEIGAFLASDAVGLTKWFTDVFTKAAEGLARIRTFAEEVGGLGNLIKQNFILAIVAVMQALTELVAKVPGVNFLFQKMGIDIKATNEQLGEMAIKLQAEANTALTSAGIMGVAEGKKREEAKKTTTQFVNNKKEETDAETVSLLTREQAWINANWQKLASDEELKENLKINDINWAKFSFQMVDQVTNQMGQGVADMILESKKFSDVIKQIWKDLARAVIAEIARMIAKWLVFQAMKGAATGGFGGFMAEGGIISEPSVITGLRSGVSYVAGEAGPEAVVPLSQIHSSRATNATMDDYNTQQGGQDSSAQALNVTVNISGQFIDGDESTWQRLIREKIVPEIHRFTMSNPTGMFNRRRGATA